jgi:contact-dependent growth inhibition (CDI) system CdiI-like immunity protein
VSDRDIATRTLDELDPPAWRPPPSDATGLVRRCHELRRKPLADFEVGDLRVAIRQEIGPLHRLVPRAVEVLETNPLVEGDYYPGELLLAVLNVDKSYWQAHVDEWSDVNFIADNVMQACEYIREPLKTFKLDTFK